MRSILLFACIVSIVGSAAAQPQLSLEEVARDARGQAYVLHRTDGGLTLYQDGYDLVVGEAQRTGDAVAFEELGRVLLPERPTAIASRDGLAYVATWGGLAVVALDAEPELRAFIPAETYWDVALGEAHAYVSRGQGGFHVYTLGEAPERIAERPLGGYRTTLALDGAALFVVAGYPPNDGEASVVAFDVTDPTDPVQEASATVGATKYDAVVVDGVLFVGAVGAIFAFSASGPDVLAPLATYTTSESFHAFAHHASGQLYAFGASYDATRGQPYTVTYTSSGLDVDRGSQLSGLPAVAVWDPDLSAFALLFDRKNVAYVDVSGEAVEMVGPTAAGYSWGAAFDGTLLFSSRHQQEVSILDLSTPDVPVLRGTVPVPGRTLAMTASDGVVYLLQRMGQQGQLWIVDARDADTPTVASVTVLGNGVGTGLALKGDLLHVTGADGELVVYSVFHPDDPRLVGTYPFAPTHTIEVDDVTLDAVTGRLLAIDRRQQRLLVFDNENRTALRLLGAIDLPERPEHVAAHDGVAFVAGTTGWHFVDIQDLAAPAVTTVPREGGTGTYSVAADASGFYASTDRLYRLDAEGAVTETFEAAYGAGLGISTSGALTVSAGDRGIYVFETVAANAVAPGAETANLSLLPPRPNPSRGHAELPIVLPEAADVSVEVTDALGRRVLQRAARPYAAGRHVLPLSLTDLAPGLYLARVRAGDTVATARVTVGR